MARFFPSPRPLSQKERELSPFSLREKDLHYEVTAFFRINLPTSSVVEKDHKIQVKVKKAEPPVFLCLLLLDFIT
jgi:hypothetical protein